MKQKRGHFVWAMGMLIFLGPGFGVGQYRIPQGVFGVGGGIGQGGDFGLQGTLGQPLIGGMRGPAHRSVAGFWVCYGDVVTSVEALSQSLPTEFRLEQNYPNPFNPETVITFALPEDSEVSLKVYDVLGREIAAVIGGHYPAGIHKAVWRPQGESSGVYFYRLLAKGQSGERVFAKVLKLTLMR